MVHVLIVLLFAALAYIVMAALTGSAALALVAGIIVLIVGLFGTGGRL